MLMQTLNPKDLVQFSKQLQEPDWLQKQRLHAWKLAEELPAPSFRYGITIALNTKGLDLDAQEYRQALQQGTEIAVLAEEDLNGAVVRDFRSAWKTQSTLIKQHLFSVLGAPQNKMMAVHQALFSNPMLVYVPKGIHVDVPVHLKNQIRAGVHCEQLLVIAEPQSSVTIIDETVSHDDHPDHALHTKGVEVIVGQGAVVNYTSIQNLKPSIFHFSTKGAAVARDGRMNWLDCTLGGKLAQAAVTTNLDAEGAESNNWGMFFGHGDQQFDLAATVRHNAPHTQADMFTRGAVTDRAKAIYRGLIKMERQAQKSNGRQRADTLLLSPDAEADNIPALEIDNADVKCSHASTIGQVDAEKLFYLLSRGIGEGEARKMIVRGFFTPLLNTIQSKALQEALKAIVEERL